MTTIREEIANEIKDLLQYQYLNLEYEGYIFDIVSYVSYEDFHNLSANSGKWADKKTVSHWIYLDIVGKYKGPANSAYYPHRHISISLDTFDKYFIQLNDLTRTLYL